MTSTVSPDASLQRRVENLRVEITAAQEKERRIREAILSRRTTLNRLEAQLESNETGKARPRDEG
ncbi:MAG TPA: hypothetical protein VKC60_03925 [Opitutaceae bacterium]|nr:hypothetical protein [Opitutaceae bacterium]